MKNRSALGILFVVVFVDLLGFGMVLPVMPLYAERLGASEAATGWLSTLYSLMQFVFAPIWGRLSDRIGGLKTVLIGSSAQALFLMCYAFIDDLAGLYVLSAAFGLGAGGIIPSYALTVRELFPAREAGWRIGTVLLFGLTGMAIGAWLGGAIFDAFASYRPAFVTAVVVNLANLAVVGGLVMIGTMPRFAPPLPRPG